MDHFSISNTTRSTIPSVNFGAIKKAVLGKKYTLSLVFIGERRMRRLNKSYRDKDKPTDILSFPLDEKSGEIFICPSASRRAMKKFGRSYENFIAFLFIHGLMHLKGMDHGSTMEKAESRLRKKFSI